MKKCNQIIALSVLTLLGTLYNTGCSEDNNKPTTTINSTMFDGSQGNCTNGGVKIEVLVNGNVDEAQTQYICNGTNGQSGQSGQSGTNITMKSSKFDNAQGSCAHGGVKIEVLVNGNVDEAQTQYICNGTNGQSGTSTTMKTTKFDDAQGDCTHGGVKIEVFVNGDVDEAQTQYICNGAQGEIQCPSGWSNCDGSCIDTNTDITNCGACARDCNQTKPQHASTMSCLASQCTVTSCEDGYVLNEGQCVSCTELPGWTKCNDQCTQIDSDNNNCGKCNNACGSKRACYNGKCLGEEYYGNTATSPDHCGEVGNRCPDGQACVQGQCKLGYGKAYCGVAIVQLGDIERCGGCDDKCDNGKICQNNQCVDGIGPTYCNGVATNTLSDVSNCGECGHRCENSNCFNGECVSAQGESYTDEMYCNNILVHSWSDSANCGSCGNTCAKGLTCSGGICQPYKMDSDSKLNCNGKDVSPYSDRDNCGKCGNICHDDCQQGICLFTSSTQLTCNGPKYYPYYDSSHCGSCEIDCGKGKYCAAGVCTAEKPTSDTITYCGFELVNPYTDINHCGGCDISCSNNQICSAGACKSKSNFVKDDIIPFGHYEQDNDTTNGKELITWRVLDKNDLGQYLIISEKSLDIQPYHTDHKSITWENSAIRSWLNGYNAYSTDNFIDAAFTTEEKDQIVQSTVSADANPKCSSNPSGNETTDKIFLLSVTEAENYFSNDKDRRAEATPYTKAKGATKDYSDFKNSSYWWLRSPGCDIACAAYVSSNGTIDHMNGYVTVDDTVAVRPVLWIEL